MVACGFTGGMLAFKASQVKNGIVGATLRTRGFANTSLWLGASNHTGGNFTWVSQQFFDLTSFVAFESSGGETENCLVSFSRRWNVGTRIVATHTSTFVNIRSVFTNYNNTKVYNIIDRHSPFRIEK